MCFCLFLRKLLLNYAMGFNTVFTNRKSNVLFVIQVLKKHNQGKSVQNKSDNNTKTTHEKDTKDQEKASINFGDTAFQTT